MSSGYAENGVDIDVLFEPRQSGDPLAADTGYQTLGVDVKNRYIALSAGDRIPTPIGYSSNGVNFRDIFAARLSVPRFPNPLPWARTDSIAASVYRHTSRAHTLNTYVQVRVSVSRDGGFFVQRITPPYNSNPNAYSTVTVTSSPAGTLWTPGQMSDFQLLFEHVSGSTPALTNGTPFGIWVNAADMVDRTIFATLDVNHSSAPATYTGHSGFRIHVRRIQYPTSNRASAVYTANFSLTMEQPALQDSNWSGTFLAHRVDGAIRHTPEGDGSNFGASSRIVFDSDGTWYVQIATSGGWVTQRSGRWLRAAFSTSADYEVVMSNPDGNISGGAGVWHNLGSSRVFQVDRIVNTNSAPGDYGTTGNATFRIREISTRGWAGLVDNFIENTITLAAAVTINQPTLLLQPVSSFTGWAGTYNAIATIEVGPPPNNIIAPLALPGSIVQNASIARAYAAPQVAAFGAAIVITSNASGQLIVYRTRLFHSVSVVNIFEVQSTETYQILNGDVSEYELRLVQLSASGFGFDTEWSDWVPFGHPGRVSFTSGYPSGVGIGFSTGASTNTDTNTTTGSARIEVRRRNFPAHFASATFSCSVTATLTGFSGSGGGTPPPDPGPGDGGGGGGSVHLNAYVPGLFTAKRAEECNEGTDLWLLNTTLDGYIPGKVISNRTSPQNLLRFTSQSGITLTLSDNTPLTLKDGSVVNSTEALGVQLPVLDHGEFRWETIISVEKVGAGLVSTIYCHDQCYAAGDVPNRYIFTHNSGIVKQ